MGSKIFAKNQNTEITKEVMNEIKARRFWSK
jgi:hypothetical protein